MFKKVKRKKEKVIKIIVSKQIVSLIKLSSKTYLKKNIDVNYEQILPLLDNYKITVEYYNYVLKNTIIILLMSYSKKYATSFYYKLAKTFFAYKTGEVLQSFNENSAKLELSRIIEGRQWDKLLKPDVYKAMLHLYEINDDKSSLLKILFSGFNKKMCKVFTVWTISSFLSNSLIAPSLSLGMLIYRKENRNFSTIMMYKVGILILAGLIGITTESYFLSSIISQFGNIILINKFTKSIAKYCMEELNKRYISLIFNNSQFNKMFMITYVHMIMLSFIGTNNFTDSFITFIYISVSNSNQYMRNSIIYGWLLASGFISNFNIIHITHNIALLYVLMGTLDINGFRDCIETIKNLITEIYATLNKIYKIIVTKVAFNIGYVINKERQMDKLIKRFPIMNTEMYPSVSDNRTMHNVKKKRELDKLIDKDITDEIKNINNEIIINKIDKKMGLMPVNDAIFNLNKNDFLDAISVDSIQQLDVYSSSSEEYYNYTKSIIFSDNTLNRNRKIMLHDSNDNIDIVENYC
jgi:hypothetical protein